MSAPAAASSASTVKLAESGSLLKLVDTAQCVVGLRVQDNLGNRGIVKWVGKLDKSPPPPGKDAPRGVTYAGVVYDEPILTSANRFDGTLSGVKLIDGAAPGTVGWLQPKKDLFFDIIPETVAEMRRRFGDRIKTWHDIEVTKFLIARKFDLKLATEMLDQHLKWEKDHLVSVDEYFPPKMAQGYPIGIQKDCYDNDGNLILIHRPGNGGKMKAEDFVKDFGLPLIMRWHIASNEQVKAKMRESGWKTQRICFIIDLKELSGITTEVGKFGQMEGKIDQDHYPEMMGRAFMINAPWYFTGLWKVVKLFVDDRTKEKIKILGEDYKKELLKYIPESALPSCAGGKNDSWLETTDGGRVGGLTPPAPGHPTRDAIKSAEIEIKEAEQMGKFIEENEAMMKKLEEEAEARRKLEEERELDSRDVSEAANREFSEGNSNSPSNTNTEVVTTPAAEQK